METYPAQPQEPPKHRSKFQVYLLIGLIAILIFVVILDVLSFTGIVNLKEDTKEKESSIAQTSNTTLDDLKKPQVQKETTWDECEVFKTEKEYLPQSFSTFSADGIEKYKPKGWLGKYFGRVGDASSLEDIPGVTIIIRKDKSSEKYIKEAFQLDNSKLTKNLHGSPAFVGIITINHNNENARLTPDNAISIITIVKEHDLIIEMHIFNESEAVFDLWFGAVCKKV